MGVRYKSQWPTELVNFGGIVKTITTRKLEKINSELKTSRELKLF